MKKGSFTFLGSGGSMGVPLIGCSCSVCTSKSKKNNRLRPSGLIKVENKTFVIDPGPDFRFQALRHKINYLDGVFITHPHFDHIAGLDDLRIFYINHEITIPCLLSKYTFELFKTRYQHLILPNREDMTLTAKLDFRPLSKDCGEVDFEGLKVTYVNYLQGKLNVTGYRFGNLAYLVDIKTYNENILAYLQGVETLIISAPRIPSSHVHFGFDDVFDFAKKIKTQRTFITHLAHDIDYDIVNPKLPDGFNLAYDGLELEFNYG